MIFAKSNLRTALRASALSALVMLPTMAAAEVTIQHRKGETSFDAVPQKVAVFDLASLDTLSALDVEAVAGVPKGEDGSVNFPEYLSAYGDEKIAGVGTLFEPNLDALKELQPDLIIIAGRSAGKYDDVAKIAPTIDLTPEGDDLVASTIESTRTLGKIFAVEAKADEKVAELEAAVAAMREAAPKEQKALVLFAVEKNIMAHAPGARFGTLYQYTGLESVMEPAEPSSGPRPEPGSPEAEAARQKQQELRDAALAANPAWIITLDRGSISSTEPSKIAERLSADEKIAATDAVKNGQVVHLDPRAWYLVGTGVQNVTNTAKTIADAFKAAK